MANFDLIYHKVDSNVELLCGWTKNEETYIINEKEVDEFKSDTPLEETKVFVEVNEEEEKVFFPQIIGDSAIISCHLLINFLNDAMAMLRYLGMIIQDFLRWEWIPIEEAEDDDVNENEKDEDFDNEKKPSEEDKPKERKKTTLLQRYGRFLIKKEKELKEKEEMERKEKEKEEREWDEREKGEREKEDKVEGKEEGNDEEKKLVDDKKTTEESIIEGNKQTEENKTIDENLSGDLMMFEDSYFNLLYILQSGYEEEIQTLALSRLESSVSHNDTEGTETKNSGNEKKDDTEQVAEHESNESNTNQVEFKDLEEESDEEDCP